MGTNNGERHQSSGDLTEDNDEDLDEEDIIDPIDDIDDTEEEEILAQDREWNQFDEIIGCIEDIVIEQQFQDLQESFLEANYEHFEVGTEENKLIYMEIFQVSSDTFLSSKKRATFFKLIKRPKVQQSQFILRMTSYMGLFHI